MYQIRSHALTETKKKTSTMSVNREVAVPLKLHEVLALGTELVLRLNYSMKVARSSSFEFAKIYAWRHSIQVSSMARDTV